MQAMREARLAAVMAEADDKQITTRTVMDLYRSLGVAVKRTTARADLKALVQRGLLAPQNGTGRRSYRAAKAGA